MSAALAGRPTAVAIGLTAVAIGVTPVVLAQRPAVKRTQRPAIPPRSIEQTIMKIELM
jgi:hypothetical protein